MERDELSMDDKLATVESLIHCEIAAHGGQRIVAGPEMEQLVTEIRQALQEQGWLNLSPCDDGDAAQQAP